MLVYLGISGLLFGETITGGPYLQNPYLAAGITDPTSMDVLWHTDTACPKVGGVCTPTCKVTYQQINTMTCTDTISHTANCSGPPRTTDNLCPPTLVTQYQVKLTGLTAGCSYNYQVVGNGGGQLDSGTFTAMKDIKDPTAGTFRFFVLGDSGQDPRSKPPDHQQNIANAILLQKPQPDFGVHVGDIIYPAYNAQGSLLWNSGSCQGYPGMYFTPYKNIIKSMVVWPSLGNHDSDAFCPTGLCCPSPDFCLNNSFVCWATTPICSSPDNPPQYLYMYCPPHNGPDPSATGAKDPNINVRNYFFDYGDSRFIFLDSDAANPINSTKNNKTDWSRITDWLVTVLDNADTRGLTWKFVFTHFPAFSSGQHGCDQRKDYTNQVRALLSDLRIQSRIDIFFSGHDHDFEYIPAQSVSPTKPFYIVTGGGGSTLDNSVCGKCDQKICDCTECNASTCKADPAICPGLDGSCYGGCYASQYSFTLVDVDTKAIPQVTITQIDENNKVIFSEIFFSKK